MNKAIIIGNLTRDPEVRNTTSGIPVASFTVAVQRRFKDASGERGVDFLPCQAWRKTAELVGEYFHKGSKIGVIGSIQTRKWTDKDGNNRTSTEIVADEIEFIDRAGNRQEQSEPQAKTSVASDPFPGDQSTDLPFDI